MLGSGQRGSIRSPYREAVDAVAGSKVPVLSVDLPTGLGSETAIRPKWTVALSALKVGMDPASCGELTVRDIGIPVTARSETGPGEFLFFPQNPNGIRRGRVLVIGGGPYAGAPALAAMAALRSGAERATVVAPSPAGSAIQTFSPDLVVRAIGEKHFQPSDVAAVLESINRSRVDSIVLGMGIGGDPESVEFARTLSAGLPTAYPMVVDAEALPVLSGTGLADANSRTRPTVATPNQGEFSRYFRGQTPAPVDEQRREAQAIALRLGVTLILKGPVDVVTDGRRSCVNRHHAAAQNVAGAGDVLAGIAGGLLAQGLEPYHAGRLAAYWAGAAGYLCAERKGPGLIASDLLGAIPLALVNGLQRVRSPVASS